MNNSYFITVDYIKKYYSGYLDPNIDADALDSFILMAQDIRIQTTLGTDLYFKFINDIETYGAPQGDNYIFLMQNFIQKSTALWTIYEAMPSLDTRITNKGIVNKTSEYSKTAEEISYNRVFNQVNNNAQFYDTRTRAYITQFPQYFPEYYTQTGINNIPAKQSNYFAGMYLPDVYLPSNFGPFVGDRLTGRGGYFLQ